MIFELDNVDNKMGPCFSLNTPFVAGEMVLRYGFKPTILAACLVTYWLCGSPYRGIIAPSVMKHASKNLVLSLNNMDNNMGPCFDLNIPFVAGERVLRYGWAYNLSGCLVTYWLYGIH